MQISSMVRMNVYQKAKRQKRGPNINLTDLMNYCEAHRLTRDSEITGNSVKFLYNMPDGCTIEITGGRPIGGIDEFMPTGWALHEPQQTVMDRIHDVLSLIRARR